MRNILKSRVCLVALVYATGIGGPALAQDADLTAQEATVAANPLKNAYFGETHVHSSYSLDGYIGGARLTPMDAYSFARGHSVVVNGQVHNIGRPLDFAAVSDHAEFLAEMYSTQVPGAPGADRPELAELRGLTTMDAQEAWFLKYVVENNRSESPQHPPFFTGPEALKGGWKVEVDAAAANYEPGVFSSIVGFEWTSAPKGGNMHRNVLFRDLHVPDAPLSAIDTQDEEKLWDWMQAQEDAGMKLFAIPHNPNASKTFMFEPTDNSGNPINAAYATKRSHFERLIEMMQIKGNSEVTQSLWPADEFSDFENAPSIANYSKREIKLQNYVRWAIIKGLEYQAKLGVNPYLLGFTGGTDSHNGLPSDVAEDNYIGSHGAADDTVTKRRETDIAGWIMGKDSNPGGLAGVWAPKNTRGEIWDAMYNREAFATSGTRIKPRFFGGAGLSAAPTDAVALVTEGYAKGVPMGGKLTGLTTAPTFTVQAMKDPVGANLDRIQIIKGWVDDQGNPQDKVYDVVWSAGRVPRADGKIPAVGNTVDLATARYTNSIGATELLGSWTDPAFDPAKPVLYYMRVIEIPTPRWTTFDAVRNGLPLLSDVPATVQERAWTSPIWYDPAKT
jgi:hypothetical protein